MKNFFCVLLVVSMLFSFSSCAIHSGLTSNVNNHTTNVVLEKNNYKIVSKVIGNASGTRVFGIGGSFKPLIERARADMRSNDNLIGTSRAVINETVETNTKFFGIVTVQTVTVSAYVIEFIE